MSARLKRRDLWTPTNPGLTMLSWVSAQDAASLEQDDAAGRVRNWLDRSGNQNDWHQATVANQPTTGVETIGGFNAVGFSLASSYFMAMDSQPFGASVDNAFVFLVMNVKSVTEATIAFTLSNQDPVRWQAHCPYSDGIVYFDCGGASGANRIQYAAGWAANAIRIMGFYCSVTDSVQQVYEGGALKASDATGHSVATSGNPRLGAGPNGLSIDTSAIGECIIINGTVSEYTRTRVEGYLAHKWGIASSLHDAHPCRWAPPSV
jgi:hypothetical protein